MKRVLTSLLMAMTLLTLPIHPGTAAPPPSPAYGVNQNFAPSSIIQFEHLSSEDGLPQSAGLAIFQDSRGYLWIGSQDGLNRYDGYSFKIFKHDLESISHNNILSIAEDRSGSLWIGTWGGGLNRLAPRFVACFTKCIPA